MAGDWLKMDSSTPEKPEVLAITARMGWEDPDMTVGKLFRVWRWFDQHTTDGNAARVTSALLDRIAGVSGFAEAMQAEGWLIVSENGLSLPKFDRHNGATAKARAQTAKRVANHRSPEESNGECNGDSVTGALAREEKRREDIKDKDTASKSSPSKRPAVQFKTFLADCKAKNEKPITGYKPVFDYAESVGLPIEMVELCWNEFYRRYNDGGSKAAKRYADWRATFRNCVEDNWFKLWWLKADGQFELTTAGHTAQRAAA